MTVERSRIRMLLGGTALVLTLGWRAPARAANPAVTVYKSPT